MSKRLLNQSRESLIYLRENDKKIAVGWKEHISNYPRAKFWPIFKSYCMIEGSLLRVSPEAWPQEVIRADWRFPQLDLHLSIYSQTHESHLKVQQLTTTLTIICWCAEICSDFGVKNTKISAELGIWYMQRSLVTCWTLAMQYLSIFYVTNSLCQSTWKRVDYAYDSMITLGIDNCPSSVGWSWGPGYLLPPGFSFPISLSLSLFEAKWARLHDRDGGEMMERLP